jgi:chromosome segregation ATPase
MTPLTTSLSYELALTLEYALMPLDLQQSKNWRKYYAALERKCVTIQDQLKAVSDERHALVEKANNAQTEMSAMKTKLETCYSTEHGYAKEVAVWKKKLLKLKTQLDVKEALVGEKSRELQTIVDEFQRYRRHQRTKELNAALTRSPASRVSDEPREERPRDDEFSGGGQLAMLRADYTSVKNQLVRSESDNLLLVRALEMARQNDGQLPAGIVHEVARITLRVTKVA